LASLFFLVCGYTPFHLGRVVYGGRIAHEVFGGGILVDLSQNVE